METTWKLFFFYRIYYGSFNKFIYLRKWRIDYCVKCVRRMFVKLCKGVDNKINTRFLMSDLKYVYHWVEFYSLIYMMVV